MISFFVFENGRNISFPEFTFLNFVIDAPISGEISKNNLSLSNEINEKIFPAKLELLDFAIKNINLVNKIIQKEIDEPYFTRRTPKDSEIDVNKSISEQFNLLRIADNERYPCFFKYKGHNYKISLTKIDTQ